MKSVGPLMVTIFCATALLVQPVLGQTPTLAAVAGGRVEGTVSNGETVFKGIPYAAPPIGKLRWRPPQPVIPWTGVRRTDVFAPPCMQSPLIVKLLVGLDVSPSENCLYLNVWTPARSASDKLPVMVWIYGGGFAFGLTNPYDGTKLAKDGVVVVTVSYRTGVFGFFATPRLSREAGHGAGNQGLQDQIAALRWVKHNISKFGGNPNNVTIFGESAGALSVSMLAASPLAKGLFERAISESGGYFSPPKERADEGGTIGLPLAKAEQEGEAFLATLGVHSLKAARALPAAKIEAAFEVEAEKSGPISPFRPDFDGYVLKGDSYRRYEEGKFNDTPILVGTNAQDGRIFVKSASTVAWVRKLHFGYGDKADEILGVYPHATPAQTLRSARQLFADVTFAWPTYAWANLQTAKGKNKAFVYYFLHKTKKYPQGAIHGADQIEIWGWDKEAPSLAAFFGESPDDAALGQQMRRYWTNFAKSGNPNGLGLPYWPAYSVKDPQVLQIDPTVAIPYPRLTRIKALDDYYAWQRDRARRSGHKSDSKR